MQSKTNRTIFTIIGGVVIIAAIIIYSYYRGHLSFGGVSSTVPTVTINNVPISVELATTTAEWVQGLSGRSGLAPNTGMLFVFDHVDTWAMWMKDMNFSLDMLWISPSDQIIKLEQNLTPASYPSTFQSDNPALYVLEIPAGTVKNDAIELGQIVHFNNI